MSCTPFASISDYLDILKCKVVGFPNIDAHCVGSMVDDNISESDVFTDDLQDTIIGSCFIARITIEYNVFDDLAIGSERLVGCHFSESRANWIDGIIIGESYSIGSLEE